MINYTERTISILLTVLLIFTALCCPSQKQETVTCSGTVMYINEFGNAVTDISSENFEACGFKLGDAVSISFSGGYKIDSLPYYNEFYGETGDLIITDHVSHYNNVAVAAISGSFVETSSVEIGEKVTFTLTEHGRYEKLLNLYYLPPARERRDDQTELEFSNFRDISCGRIKEGTIYRSASPFDPFDGRTEIIPVYISKMNIQTIIDIADDEASLKSYEPLPADVASLEEDGRIFLCAFTVDFENELTRTAVAKICRVIINEPGPYLIHCSLGQDRTGFVCAVLEGLCGADCQEILDDYMLSYANLYGLTKTSDADKYELMSHRLISILEITTGADDPTLLTQTELEQGIQNYLLSSGLTREEVAALVSRLCE